jgi:hypothetical protein
VTLQKPTKASEIAEERELMQADARTLIGRALIKIPDAISVPRGETAVLQHFQAQMPYGLFVHDAQ